MNRRDRIRLLAGVAAAVALALACESPTLDVDPESRAATLTLTPAADTIAVGDVLELNASARNAQGDPMERLALSWGVRAPGIVALEPEGRTARVRGTAPGRVRVWVAGGSLLAEADIVVTGPVVRVAVFPDTARIALGGQQVFEATALVAGGHAVANPVVAWTTSSPTVLTVTSGGGGSGTVRGVGIGTAQVTASVDGVRGTAQVRVTPTPVATVQVGPDPAEVTLGRTLRFNVTLRDQAGTVLSGRDIAWTSSNPAVLRMDGSGHGQALAYGSAVVTATSEGKSGTSVATVVAQSSLLVRVFPASPLLNPGDSVTFSAQITNSSGAVVGGLPVTWSTVDPAVATITSVSGTTGVARAVAPGTTAVTAVVEGYTGNTQIAVRAPLPTLASVTPDTVSAGRVADLTLAVTGTGFHPHTRIRWNGTDRPTTYLSATRLQAVVPPTDLEEPGTAAVTVHTPAPGGGTTPPLSFRVLGTRSGILGDTVRDQLKPAGDVDEFTFEGRAGQDVVLRFQSLSGSPETMIMSLLNPARDRIGYATSQGTDRTMEQNATGPFRLRTTGVYTVQIAGASGFGTEQGGYRFHVMPVNPAPERRPAAVTPGDTVRGEDISPVGDADEFTFSGSAGDRVTVYFQATSGAASDDLWLELIAPDGRDLASVGSDGDDGTLDGQRTRGQILPVTGTYTVNVRGFNVSDDGGPYRFRVIRIDPRPETVSPVVPLDRVVEGESLSPRGDVDRYTFQGTAGQEINAFLQGRTGDYGDLFFLEVVTPDNDRLLHVHSHGNDATLDAQGAGPARLPRTGTYTLWVSGDNLATEGAYRFRIMPIHLPPEAVVPGVTAGQTVEGEEISPVGDIDHFTFEGTRGQAVNLNFQARSGLARDYLVLYLIDPEGNTVESLGSYGNDPTLDLRQTGRVELQHTGTYRIRVRGWELDDQGPYRFRIVPLQ